MKLTIIHALEDGMLIALKVIGILHIVKYGFLMLLMIALLFAEFLGKNIDKTGLAPFTNELIMSPLLFLMGLCLYYFIEINKDTKKRTDYAFEEIGKQIKKNDFYKPLFKTKWRNKK